MIVNSRIRTTYAESTDQTRKYFFIVTGDDGTVFLDMGYPRRNKMSEISLLKISPECLSVMYLTGVSVYDVIVNSPSGITVSNHSEYSNTVRRHTVAASLDTSRHGPNCAIIRHTVLPSLTTSPMNKAAHVHAIKYWLKIIKYHTSYSPEELWLMR